MENRTYKIRKDNLLDALEDIDNFKDKVDELEDKYGFKKYTYTIGLDPVFEGDGNGFDVIVNIKKNERTN